MQTTANAFYVAVTGNDRWSGKLPAPDADRTDGPVATLARAIELARQSDPKAPRHIIVRGGEYQEVAITLDARDAGLIIEAAEGETPILYGGRRITGWQPDGDTFWSAPLPDQDWDFRMLQVNGRFCPRARLPQEGTFTHESVFDVRWMSTTGGGWERKPTEEELTTLQYKPGDLGAWLDVRNAELTLFHSWDDSTVGVRSLDPETRVIRFSNPAGHPAGGFGGWIPRARTFIVWNVREGMSAPGQWYLDRAAGKVVYWPLPGEDLAQVVALAPTTECIIRLVAQEGQLLADVTLRGLTLSIANTPLIAADFAAGKLPGAITGEGPLLNCRLEGLTIRNVAGHGIKLRDQANVGARIDGCETDTTGAGGIYLNGNDSAITECLIHHVGLMYPAAMGINFGGNRLLISHNEIRDTTYSGIGGGGGEGHLIEYNDISQVMRVLNDGAAIYTTFTRGNVLRGNYAHDISGGDEHDARHAYYLDEQAENCVVCDNVSVGVAWAWHHHMAWNNTLWHNAFLIEGDAKITFPRSRDYSLEGNVIYATGSIRFSGIDVVKRFSRNLFYSGQGRVDGVTLEDYREARQPTSLESNADHTLADPLFVDPQQGDFRFQPDSLAHRLGIAPFDVSQAGRTRR